MPAGGQTTKIRQKNLIKVKSHTRRIPAKTKPKLPTSRQTAQRQGRAQFETKETARHPRRAIPSYKPTQKHVHPHAVEQRERTYANKLVRHEQNVGLRKIDRAKVKAVRTGAVTLPGGLKGFISPVQRGEHPKRDKPSTDNYNAGLFGFGGKGMHLTPKLPVVGNLDVEDVATLGVEGLATKKAVKTGFEKLGKIGSKSLGKKAATSTAGAGVRYTTPRAGVKQVAGQAGTATEKGAVKEGAKVVAQRVKTRTVSAVKEATPRRVAQRSVAKAERGVEKTKTFAKNPIAETKLAGVERKAAFGTKPIRTTVKTAKPVAVLGVGATAAVQKAQGKKSVPEAFISAQSKEFKKNPKSYIVRSGGFVPGALAGTAKAAYEVAKGNAAQEIDRQVEATKSLAGYLSTDPKKQEKLAHEYAAGPAVVAAITSGVPRRLLGKTKGVKARNVKLDVQSELNRARIRGASRTKHGSKEHNKLVKKERKRVGKENADAHIAGGRLLANREVSLTNPHLAERQLADQVKHMDTKQPEGALMAQLLEHVREGNRRGVNHIEESGLGNVARSFAGASHRVHANTTLPHSVEVTGQNISLARQHNHPIPAGNPKKGEKTAKGEREGLVPQTGKSILETEAEARQLRKRQKQEKKSNERKQARAERKARGRIAMAERRAAVEAEAAKRKTIKSSQRDNGKAVHISRWENQRHDEPRWNTLPEDQKVWVYHATSDKEVAERWVKEGIDPAAKPSNLARQRYEAGKPSEFAPGRGLGEGVYVGHRPADVSGYGHYVVAIRVPKRQIKATPEQTNLGANDWQALKVGDAEVRGKVPASDVVPITNAGVTKSVERQGRVPNDERTARALDAADESKPVLSTKRRTLTPKKPGQKRYSTSPADRLINALSDAELTKQRETRRLEQRKANDKAQQEAYGERAKQQEELAAAARKDYPGQVEAFGRNMDEIRKQQELEPATYVGRRNSTVVPKAGGSTSNTPIAIRKKTGELERSGKASTDPTQIASDTLSQPAYRDELIRATTNIYVKHARGISPAVRAAANETLSAKNQLPDKLGPNHVLTDAQARAALPHLPEDTVLVPAPRSVKEIMGEEPDLSVHTPEELFGDLKTNPKSHKHWVAIDRHAHDQLIASSKSEGAFRSIRAVGGFGSRALLATPGFALAQIPTEAIPLGLDLGWRTGKAPSYLKSHQALPDNLRSMVESVAGNTIQQEYRETRQRALDPQSPEIKLGLDTTTLKNVASLKSNPIGWFDRNRGNIYRQIAVHGQIDRLSSRPRQMRKLMESMGKNADDIADANAALKGKSHAERVAWMGQHPEVMDAIGRRVNDMQGDWMNFTGRSNKKGQSAFGEEHLAAMTLFYPMLRYTTKFLFDSFPKYHPFLAAYTYWLGVQNTADILDYYNIKGKGVPNNIADIARPATRNKKGQVDPHGLPFISRANPGQNALFEVGATGVDQQSLMKLSNPLAAPVVSALTNKDAYGRPLKTDWLHQPQDLGSLEKLKAAAIGEARMLGPVSLAERGIVGKQDPLHFFKQPKKQTGRNAAFWNQVITPKNQKFWRSVSGGAVFNDDAWKSKAIAKMLQAQKDFFDAGQVTGTNAPQLRGALKRKQQGGSGLTLKQATLKLKKREAAKITIDKLNRAAKKQNLREVVRDM